MNSDNDDKTTQDADGGWWVSVRGDNDARKAMGPFASEIDAKTVALILLEIGKLG